MSCIDDRPEGAETIVDANKTERRAWDNANSQPLSAPPPPGAAEPQGSLALARRQIRSRIDNAVFATFLVDSRIPRTIPFCFLVLGSLAMPTAPGRGGSMSSSAPFSDESDLLQHARNGDDSAVAQLYADHVDAARRLGMAIAGPEDTDELVAEGFSRVLGQLATGKGPTSNFRSYLYATIRNLHRDRLRTRDRSVPASDMPWLLDETVASAEEVAESLSEDQAVRALQSLPERWRRILWQLEVEGLSVSEAARVHEMAPTAVSMLSFRAREGLRMAYLGQRITAEDASGDCRWVRDRLVKYVRGSVSPRVQAKIDAHLPTCPGCSAILDDLEETNRKFAALLLPVVLVGGAATLDGGAGDVGDSATAESAGRTSPASGRSTTVGARTVAHAGRAAVKVPVLAAAAATLFALVVVPALLPDSGGTRADPGPPAAPRTTTPATPDPPAAGPARPDRRTSSTVRTVARPLPDPSASTAQTTPSSDRPPGLAPQPKAAPPLLVVRPVPPTSTAIDDCETYGSLRLPSTDGVAYRLVEGDGRQGPWAVEATSQDGHRIADGARTRFTGDLKAYYECPHWTTPPAVTWDAGTLEAVLTTPVTATGPGPNDLRVEVTFAETAHFVEDSFSAAGWDCRAPGGEPLVGFSLGPGDAATCHIRYEGGAVPDLSLAFLSSAPPSGSATLYSDGVERDSSTYS
jgi:RNA polymerase sigma factor (sigma-70 family)